MSYKSSGSFDGTKQWLKSLTNEEYLSIMEMYAQKGVDALSSATPIDTGLTAASWGYIIEADSVGVNISWTNSSLANDGSTPVVILLQYGHGTGTGGYVQGQDFINPAISHIFDDIAEAVWRVVSQR